MKEKLPTDALGLVHVGLNSGKKPNAVCRPVQCATNWACRSPRPNSDEALVVILPMSCLLGGAHRWLQRWIRKSGKRSHSGLQTSKHHHKARARGRRTNHFGPFRRLQWKAARARRQNCSRSVWLRRGGDRWWGWRYEDSLDELGHR